MKIKILETLPNNRAVVSTRGLRRVVMKPSDRVVAELLNPASAAALVASVKRCGCEAVAEKYAPAIVPFKSKQTPTPFRSAK